MSDENPERSYCEDIAAGFVLACQFPLHLWPVAIIVYPMLICMGLAAVISAVFGVLMLLGWVRP
jgi:hypothetical protein